MKQRVEQTEFCPTRPMKQSSKLPKRSNEYNRVQLFEGRLALNRGLSLFCTTSTYVKRPSCTFYGEKIVYGLRSIFVSLPLILTLLAANICHFLITALNFFMFFSSAMNFVSFLFFFFLFCFVSFALAFSLLSVSV